MSSVRRTDYATPFIAALHGKSRTHPYFAERGLKSLEHLWDVDPRRVVAPVVQLALPLG